MEVGLRKTFPTKLEGTQPKQKDQKKAQLLAPVYTTSVIEMRLWSFKTMKMQSGACVQLLEVASRAAPKIVPECCGMTSVTVRWSSASAALAFFRSPCTFTFNINNFHTTQL